MMLELPKSPCLDCSLALESKMVESSPALLREECSICDKREKYAFYTIYEGQYTNIKPF